MDRHALDEVVHDPWNISTYLEDRFSGRLASLGVLRAALSRGYLGGSRAAAMTGNTLQFAIAAAGSGPFSASWPSRLARSSAAASSPDMFAAACRIRRPR